MVTITPFPVIQIIGGVMFTASSNLKFIWVSIISLLQSFNIKWSILAWEQRVLPWSFLASPPSGVSKYVYIWWPKCQSCQSHVVHCSCFRWNNLQRHLFSIYKYIYICVRNSEICIGFFDQLPLPFSTTQLEV